MEFKNTDRLLKLRFLSKHRKAIIVEYLKPALKTGYVFIRADSHFRAAEKPWFIERSFDESKLISLHEQEATGKNTVADEGRWVFYEVHWDSDKTSDYLKKPF